MLIFGTGMFEHIKREYTVKKPWDRILQHVMGETGEESLIRHAPIHVFHFHSTTVQ